MRLAGGNRTSGRIEFYNGRFWGTVCRNSWSASSSDVVCRQLGLGNTGTIMSYGAGPSSVPVFFQDVMCNGSEPNILACPHTRIGRHSCGHNSDVGVVCSELYG